MLILSRPSGSQCRCCGYVCTDKVKELNARSVKMDSSDCVWSVTVNITMYEVEIFCKQ